MHILAISAIRGESTQVMTKHSKLGPLLNQAVIVYPAGIMTLAAVHAFVALHSLHEERDDGTGLAIDLPREDYRNKDIFPPIARLWWAY